MTKIPDEAIREFKVIFKQSYGKELSDKEAYVLAGNVLNLYKAVYPTPSSSGTKLEHSD